MINVDKYINFAKDLMKKCGVYDSAIVICDYSVPDIELSKLRIIIDRVGICLSYLRKVNAKSFDMTIQNAKRLAISIQNSCAVPYTVLILVKENAIDIVRRE